MYEIIYEIYIGNYHFDTVISEEGLSYLLGKAEHKAEGREVRIKKKKVPIQEINRMMQDKIEHNERLWAEAKKTKNPIEYVEKYWMIDTIKKDRELAIYNT